MPQERRLNGELSIVYYTLNEDVLSDAADDDDYDNGDDAQRLWKKKINYLIWE